MTTQYYTFNGTSYVPDANGACAGVSWIVNGVTFVTIWDNAPVFNGKKRICQLSFEKFISSAGYLGKISEYSYVMDEINCPRFNYGLVTDPKFGQNEPEPWVLDSEGNPTTTLKTGLISELQFFVDNVIQGKNNIPFPIGNALIGTIVSIEQITT